MSNISINLRHELESTRIYDVFFICRKTLRELSFVQATVHKLEKQNIKCSYEERNFLPGKRITECYCYFIENSKNIAIVLTKSSIEDVVFQSIVDITIKYNINRSLPVIMLLLDDQIPKQLICNPYLIRVGDEKVWLNQLIEMINHEVQLSDLENLATFLRNYLFICSDESKMDLLKTPVSWELFQFFSKAHKANLTITGLGACGITIQDDSVTIDMLALQCNSNKSNYIAESYRAAEFGEKGELTIFLDHNADICASTHPQFVSCLRDICHQIIRRPQSESTGWYLGFLTEGDTRPSKAETNVLNIVRDAVTEKSIASITCPKFLSLSDRLKSFNKWPKSESISPIQIAEAGFFFEGPNDFVRCFYCAGGICNWKKYDDPWRKHAGWFPYCPFVKMNKTSEFIREARLNVVPYLPFKDEYKSVQKRKKTFVNFPNTNKLSLDTLAESGFYAVGLGETIACHYCGATFSSTSIHPNDDIWRAHGNLSENCPYVKKFESEKSLENIKYEPGRGRRVITFSIQYEKEIPSKHNVQVLISNSPQTPLPPKRFSDIVK